MMMIRCEKTTWDGLEALELRAFDYGAWIIPSLGANVIRLWYEGSGENFEILRTPPAAAVFLSDPFAYGVPVLFPANRVSGGFYEWDGVRYRFPQNRPNGMHIHGVLHNRPWPPVSYHDSREGAFARLELDTRKDGDLRNVFPADILFRLDISLTRHGLGHRFSVENGGDHSFPAGLAYHTAFRLPFRDGTPPENIRMLLPLAARCVDDPVSRLPTGAVVPLDDFEQRIASAGGAPPLEQDLDFLYTSRARVPREAILRDTLRGWEVVYTADNDNRYWIIWNGNGTKDFIAIEPQTWLSNAMNLPDPRALGAVMVPPGQSWTCATTIAVRPAPTLR
ncbi:MAG: aldose 1-epimerase [Treponema sp.]|jgi:aldose 1-epimerase|nr:aldose 1-epimerase [Treponema sp.]